MHSNSTESSPAWQTLAEVLQHRAQETPDQLAFTFEDASGERVQWTFAELDARAKAIAFSLSDECDADDRVLLVYPPGLEFIAAYFGCFYAGVLPVPATYPKPRRPMPRLDSIAKDCQPQLVLTHSSVLKGLNLDEQSPALASIAWKATDELPTTSGKNFIPVDRSSEDLAFLQYTSGSTSEPRGVMISHGNLMHNLAAICEGFAIDTQSDHVSQGVFWLPAYHDMGLIGGVLCPLYVGGISHLLAPTTFLRTPLRWLELMSETGASISGSPNFGYDYVVQKTTPEERDSLNLEKWRLAFCGAEPIHPGTLERFAEAFAAASFNSSAFYPCYGLAESTLLATGGKGPAEPRIVMVDRQKLGQHQAERVETSHSNAASLVGCGSPRNQNAVAVVDPQSCLQQSEGCVGEIWIAGGSVARGYWGREGDSCDTFGASLSGEANGGYLRTGDLGFFLDGDLFVTGRLKDVIIIRGSNHYPHDIERTAENSHEAVDMGAAFSVEGQREEQLVVVHQIRREHRKADMDEVLRSIRTSIVEEHELDPQSIVLIRPASLPITSSGKVQRSRCRDQYLAGELSIVAEWTKPVGDNEGIESGEQLTAAKPSFLQNLEQADQSKLSAEVEEWLIGWLTARAGLEPGTMQANTPFAELGIDSLTAVEISQDMDEVLGLQLPPMVIWSCPTAAELSVYLTDQLTAEDDNSSVPDSSSTH